MLPIICVTLLRGHSSRDSGRTEYRMPAVRDVCRKQTWRTKRIAVFLGAIRWTCRAQLEPVRWVGPPLRCGSLAPEAVNAVRRTVQRLCGTAWKARADSGEYSHSGRTAWIAYTTVARAGGPASVLSHAEHLGNDTQIGHCRSCVVRDSVRGQFDDIL